MEFTVSQSVKSESVTTVKVTLDLEEVETEDIKEIVLTKEDGTKQTITVEQLQNGLEVEIPANSAYQPVFTITPKQDATYEVSEKLKLNAKARCDL